MLCCPSLREIFLFPPSSGLGSGAGYSLHRRRRSRLAVHETASKKSLTTGRHASRARFGAGEGDVTLAHVGPLSDLAQARRTAIAFLAQRQRENAPR